MAFARVAGRNIRSATKVMYLIEAESDVAEILRLFARYEAAAQNRRDGWLA
ncbi:hypothetical protein [Arthrobacter cryoconiti]|uniref:hypothetical protein n=1 Tax=Arthrobacter cryoconiti TaxID=748907 RepID=UPI001E5209EB|nr:hypothetical protein [Arthrobacter cryoconiti]